MAIIFENQNHEKVTSFEGSVVDIYTETVRVMSDVWADETRAVVYDGTSDEYQIFTYGFGYNLNNEELSSRCVRAMVDADYKLIQMYRAKRLREYRHSVAVEKWTTHNRYIEFAHKCNLSVREYKKLERTYDGEMYSGCRTLLETKKFRNKFRESLANQLREWLAEPNNKYPKPFSPKQADYVRPYSRFTF